MTEVLLSSRVFGQFEEPGLKNKLRRILHTTVPNCTAFVAVSSCNFCFAGADIFRFCECICIWFLKNVIRLLTLKYREMATLLVGHSTSSFLKTVDMISLLIKSKSGYFSCWLDLWNTFGSKTSTALQNFLQSKRRQGYALIYFFLGEKVPTKMWGCITLFFLGDITIV